MKFTTQQYAQALYESVQETNPKDYDKVLDNFVKILAQNGDLGKHPEIEAEYRRLEMKAKGLSVAEITVAQEMEINSGIISQLNRIVGGKMEVKKKIDQGIIGGIVVRVNDTLIDASLKTRLENLNNDLKS